MTERIAWKSDFNMCEQGSTVFNFYLATFCFLAHVHMIFMFKGVRGP